MSGQNKCGNLVVVDDRFIHLDYCNDCEKCRFLDSQQIENFYLDDFDIDMDMDDVNIGIDIDISVEFDIDNNMNDDMDMDMDMDDFDFGDICNLTIDDDVNE